MAEQATEILQESKTENNTTTIATGATHQPDIETARTEIARPEVIVAQTNENEIITSSTTLTAWQQRANELADHAVQHLSNRLDCMGGYRLNNDNEMKGTCVTLRGENEVELRNDLTRRLRLHFRGANVGGIYTQSRPVDGEPWTTKIACIDLDLKDDYPEKEKRRERNLFYAETLQSRLAKTGIPV